MLIFAELRKSLSVIGLQSFDHPKGSTIAFVSQLTIFILGLYGLATVLLFIVFKALTFAELAQAVASFDIDLYCLMAYTILLLHRIEILQLLNDLDTKFKQRKCEKQTFKKQNFKVKNRFLAKMRWILNSNRIIFLN